LTSSAVASSWQKQGKTIASAPAQPSASPDRTGRLTRNFLAAQPLVSAT
jgi:hypothetical protein